MKIFVKQKTYITPHLLRITFKGNALAEFPADAQGGYIKLLFESDHRAKPEMRTYTIRHIDHQQQTIEVDFVAHGDQGLASRWAQTCTIGSALEIRGPGPRKLANPQADWYFFIGDLSSLPAINVNLEHLQENAVGYVMIVVDNDSDIHPVNTPKGVVVEWIKTSNNAENRAKTVMDTVAKKNWLNGDCAVWLAGEFTMVKHLKTYFRDHRKIEKQNAYYSSYWKQGLTEPDHKKEKQTVMLSDA
ncbi:siderophore-interacting protein [Agarilytica rhodophyticola]|uniref:siderophore-interacting protein n=1 Tax=Agarilytica rhodophyticola TaxID=1737490 RepID=UPI000B342A97|nr:siderophore-interacting protein [Agarilytica rhodophyticola]